MNFKKAKVEGRIVNVVNLEDLEISKEFCEPGNTAVEIEKSEGDMYVLPYRPNATTYNKPGVYNVGNVGVKAVFPEDNNIDEYKPEVIDLTSSKSMREYIAKQDKLRDIENEILTTPNNIFTPHIDDEDTPLMKGLKQAVLQKHIDIDKYSDSYGENYPNDKRKFKEHDISIKLFERHIDVLGIKAVLVLSDKSPDVPNPMGKPIYISLNYNEDDGEVDCIAEDNTE